MARFATPTIVRRGPAGRFSRHAAVGAWLAAASLLLTAHPGLAATTPRGVDSGPAGAAPPVLTSRRWTIDQGLPSDSVYAITQSSDGYLWIGTPGGLVRFDGVRFVLFDSIVPPAHAPFGVATLLPSRGGGLWVGSGRTGLQRYREGVFTPVPLRGTRIRALWESRDGTLWVAGDRGLVRRAPDGSVEEFAELTSTYVYAIVGDPDDGFWLGTSAGLYRKGPGDRRPTATGVLLQGAVVTTLARDGTRALWVGTMRGDVFRVEGPRVERIGAVDGTVWRIIRDRKGATWIASDRGLMRVGAAGLELVTREHGLDARVLDVFEDREGSLWVGTRYGGLVSLSAGRVTTIGRTIEHPSIVTVFEDRRGILWFGSVGGGLGRLRNGILETFGVGDGLASDMIGPILEDRRGRIWFGPRTGDRLQWFENGRFGSVPLQGSVVALHEDEAGALWVGTTGHGLYRLKDGRLTRWTVRDGLRSRAVRWIEGDGEGGLWLSTPRGLVRFREGPTRIYTTSDGLASDWVTCLYRDPEGPLWIGMERGGLARFQDGRFTNIGVSNGLCDSQVLSILDDRLGNLWMSSPRGIFRVSKQELNAVAQGYRTTVTCKAYGRGDGMESAQCNGGYQPSAWLSRDGRLWFPTVRGLAVVDPLPGGPTNEVPPPVWVEAVRADGKAIPLGGPGALPAGVKRLDVDYTALSFVVPDRVLFRHRMSGFDDQWVDAGTRRSVSYTNLRPGRYTFEVLACNNDGVWNQRGARYEFSVAPFFYQTRWFYGVVGLALLGAGLGLHTLRLRDLQLRHAVLLERTELSQEIHDHISQVMTGIGLQLDAAAQGFAQGSPASSAHLERANRLTKQGIEETRLILRNLREGPLRHQVSHERLDEALTDTVAPFIEGTGVRLKARTRGEAFPLTPAARRELFQVGQEAVTNALRHGQPRQIEVTFIFEPEGVRLTVSDDGQGFSPESVTGSARGLGLKGMADRVARHQGTLEIRSQPGEGTLVQAFFPRRPRWS